MTLQDFLERVKDLPPETLICVAEVDEAFASQVADIELVANASAPAGTEDGIETVDLAHGQEQAVVIRW